ncbi:MAG: hypothetical protein PHD76_12495 [Methylacidiphilales bacterium]|nr:hypothetical protein [Candidatus Methylacidiphilales bacterium]
MKRSSFLRLAFLGACSLGTGLSSVLSARAESKPGEKLTLLTAPKAKDRSLQLEIEHAIGKGLAFLQSKQSPGGFWSSPDYPALTALVLTAFAREPAAVMNERQSQSVQKGYAYLLGCVKPDGGIYVKELANYNTSVAMLALVAAGPARYASVLQNARNFIIGQQGHYPKVNGQNSPYEGGVGYGDDGPHSDMSNTAFALEALHQTQFLRDSSNSGAAKDLNWAAAVEFLQRCQNLPKYNKQPWASGDPQNVGGFVYDPMESKAGETTLPNGKKGLRSYGSMSYAGLMSYIFADLKKDDPRVTAVYDWTLHNYTMEENPAMGAQGLYYYYHMMAKALSIYGAEKLPLAGGKQADWRRDMALKLINLQQNEGYWVNSNGRWWEKDPVLVTAYAVLALEIIHPGV